MSQEQILCTCALMVLLVQSTLQMQNQMITLEDGIYAGTATPSSGGGGGGGSSNKYGMTIDDVFGGWLKTQREHFNSDGIYDQMIVKINHK